MGEQENTTPLASAPQTRPAEQEELEKTLTDFSAKNPSLAHYADDIMRMLAYCSGEGKAVSEAVQKFHSATGATTTNTFENVLKLHEQLCAVVAPATPRSLAATDFWGKRRKGDLRRVVTEALFLILLTAAIVGLIFYVLLSTKRLAVAAAEGKQTVRIADSNDQAAKLNELTDPNQSDPNGPNQEPRTVTEVEVTQAIYLSAAILGAAFSGLFTMQHYIRARTFDPNYFFVYLIRFAVGAVAGVLLANFGKGLFEENDTISKLGPSGIALLGGYSAEAVRQILDRLVQVLVTVVAGRDAASERLGVAQELLSIADKKAGEAGKPEAIKTAVAELIKTPAK